MLILLLSVLVCYGLYKYYKYRKTTPAHPSGYWTAYIWKFENGRWFQIRHATNSEEYIQLQTQRAIQPNK